MHRNAVSDTNKTPRCVNIQMCKHPDVHARFMFLEQMETIKRHQQPINSAISICSAATSIQSILELIFQFAPSLKTSSSCPLGALTAVFMKPRHVSVSLGLPLQREPTSFPISQYLCWVGLNAAAKVLRMIRCGGRPPPSPNQYLITNKVKEMSSKVIHNFDPQQMDIYLRDTLANFWNCFYQFFFLFVLAMMQ